MATKPRDPSAVGKPSHPGGLASACPGRLLVAPAPVFRKSLEASNFTGAQRGGWSHGGAAGGAGTGPTPVIVQMASLSTARPPSPSSLLRGAAEGQVSPAKSGHSHGHEDSARTSAGATRVRSTARPPRLSLSCSLAGGPCRPVSLASLCLWPSRQGQQPVQRPCGGSDRPGGGAYGLGREAQNRAVPAENTKTSGWQAGNSPDQLHSSQIHNSHDACVSEKDLGNPVWP